MIYFRSDYSLGAHPAVMEALMKTNSDHTDGYGLDPFSEACTGLIRQLCGCPDAHVHYFIGGTPCNTTAIAAALRPYEGVISPSSGHIYVHETGSIEAGGHRVFAVPSEDGKLRPADIEAVLLTHEDEHTVMPRMVYITHPTEIGGLYTKAELTELHDCCQRYGLTLYLDGARLGTALTARQNDLTIREIAALTDAFYIGGTKLGALFGEALVMVHPEKFDPNFRYMMKRQGAMLSKGRLIPIQLQALLAGGEDSLYYSLGRRENELAAHLADGIVKAGRRLWRPQQTNQVFVVLDNETIARLEKDFFFYVWCPLDRENSVIRLVINWGTTTEDVDALIRAL